MPNNSVYKRGRAQLDSQYLTRESKILARTRLALSHQGTPPDFTLRDSSDNSVNICEGSDDSDNGNESEDSCVSADNTDNDSDSDTDPELDKDCSVAHTT